MPTERFIKLRSDKKELITAAVVREFQRTSYGEMHISNIARNACISRASVYTYFQDKEDIFQFAVQQSVAGNNW